MSSLTVTNIVSLKSFKPNKSDSSTKSNQVEALKQLDGAKGCKGVVFEGVAREEPDVSVRCIEWDSVEAEKSFESSATSYTKAMQSATSDTLYVRQYKLFSKVNECLSANPKCIEYVVFTLKDSVSYDEFIPHWRQAVKAVEASPGCCPVALGQGVENSQQVVQIQGWMTLEDHIEGFKKRDDLPSIMGPLTEVVNEYVENGWKGFKAYHLLLTAPGEAL